MEAPPEPESISSCRNASDVSYYARRKVEVCIQNYMSLEATAKYLEKHHKISKSVTQIVWEQLREENPEFFTHFQLRCKMVAQLRMFNVMLTKQAVGMFEEGLLHISDASPSVKALLRQLYPQRVHHLETLASKRKLCSASLAVPYAHGSSVAQSQNPYEQQDQVLNSASFSMPYANVQSVAQRQILYDQQDQLLNSAMPNANGPSVAQSQNPYEQQDQVLNSASFSMSYENFPSVAQSQNPYDQVFNSAMPNPNGLSVAPSHMSNDQFNSIYYSEILAVPHANGPSVTQFPIPFDQQDQHLYATSFPYANGPSNNSLVAPNFAPASTDEWFQLNDPACDYTGATTNPWSSSDNEEFPFPFPIDTATMPEEDLSTFDHNELLSLDPDTILARMDLNEEKQQHLNGQQYQPHWQQQQQQHAQIEGSNWLDNGESIDQLLGDNFDINPSMHMDGSLHQQQAGGVTNHHPESEAFNNQESGVNGHNGPDELLQQLNRHNQPHLQLQQNVQVEKAQQTMQCGGRNNGLVNGEQLFSNFDKHQCFDQQQAGVVQRHHPEFEALNNPDSAQLVMQPSEQPQHQNGHCQPQQNVPVETLQRGGGSSDHQFCNNFDKSCSKRMCTSVDEQEQAGRVKRHHPESEALNNPNTGTQTWGVKQQRPPRARATTRSVKAWEQYESEETKQ